ncbi:uncharacterized protein LOC113289787 [Papaver somniferum]|uniref:uncharacterized protein LOC113289787 n=1 Tax=Papaver somniferum TaxID=3469 RepID=UPI000E6F53E7|nr:uncharacterized protein LOC113289787 [Papaver somniferum]XP_026394944.1 uncharacterized protein LOC113289787 [Papaver somniferum]
MVRCALVEWAVLCVAFTILGVFAPLAFIKRDSVSNRLGLQSLLVRILTGDMGTCAVSTCLELGDICREVGLPSGVLNIVTELSPEVDALLTSYPHVDKVPFFFNFHRLSGDASLNSAEQWIRSIELKLVSATGLFQSEKEAWQRDLEDV